MWESGATTASRPEGDARERSGRFSRAHWAGATAALPEYLYTDLTPRILTTPRSSAYIKIAEGCDHPCSFCIIPQLRGKFRSRRLESIVAEAENLIAQGVREITLIGQDTTCYGEDLGLHDGLSTLLESLAALPGLRWLRFLYAYPNKITTRLLETIARHDNIAKYLDVPLQHASPSVLKRMKRGGTPEVFLRLIAKARAIVPGIALRTSFIVGFPGETDADFAQLCEFVTQAQLDWLGVFSYSDEEGAAAFSLDPSLKVPKRTIEARRRRLMKPATEDQQEGQGRVDRQGSGPVGRGRVRRDPAALGGPHPAARARDRRQGPHQRLRPPRDPRPRHLLPRPHHRIPRLRRRRTDFGIGGNSTGIDRNIKCNYI
jgi:ribosomal protein S12 methylthiotransferase